MREKILTTAERLFADRGFDGVSLRELTAQAHVNLAAVNYYFGTKEKLYEEIVNIRIRPLNEARLALLAGALSDAGAEPVPLEDHFANLDSIASSDSQPFKEEFSIFITACLSINKADVDSVGYG